MKSLPNDIAGKKRPLNEEEIENMEEEEEIENMEEEEEIENMEDEEEDKNIKGDQENDESDDDKMIQVDPIAKDIDQNNGNNEVGSEDEGSSSGSENDNNVADSEAGGSSGGSESDDDEANSKDGGSSGDKGVGKESHSEESEDEMVKGDKDEGRASTGKGKRGKETMEDEENRETTEDEENEETMEDKENEETMEDEENEETMEDEDEGSLGGKDMGKESSSEESEDESGNNEQTISKSEDDREGRIQESCSAIHRKVSQGCHEVHMMGNLMDKWKDWGSAVIDGVYYRKQSGAFDAKERHSRSKDIIICSRQYDGTNACRCFFLTTREGLLQLTEDRNRVLKKPRDSGDLPKSPKGDIRTRWTDINQCSVSSGVDFYELVPSNQNVRMIFDTEMMTEVIKKNVSETDVWEAFEYLLSDFIHKEYERTVEWVVKDASDTSKISRHYVAQDVGLKDFVSGGGDMCRKFISFLQAMRTSDVEEVKKRAECLFYIEKGKEKCLVDDSIYTTNQNIRSLGSSKHVKHGEKPRMLRPLIGGKVKTDMDEKDYRDFFFKSCVRLTEEEANKAGMLWIEVEPNTKKRATGGQPSGQGSQKKSKGEESPRMPINPQIVNHLNKLFGKCFKEYKGALIDTSLSSVYTLGGLVMYEIYLENNLCVINGSKNHKDKKQSSIGLNRNKTWFHCFGSCGERDDMKTQSILRWLSDEKVKEQLFSPRNEEKLRNAGNAMDQVEEEETETSTTPPVHQQISLRQARKDIPKHVELVNDCPRRYMDEHVMPIMNTLLTLVIHTGVVVLESTDFDPANPFLINPKDVVFEDLNIEFTVIKLIDGKNLLRKEKFNAYTYWKKSRERRTCPQIVFIPDPPPDLKDFNLFRGWPIQTVDVIDMGLIEPILDHFRTIWARKNDTIYDYILSWYADIFQNPNKKLGVALVLASSQGAGKDIINGLLMRLLFGSYFASTNDVNRITARFNAQYAHKLLVLINEVESGGGYKAANAIKSLITDEYQELEKKGTDVIQIKSLTRYVCQTNNRDPFRIEKEDRRFACFEISDAMCGNFEYFTRLEECIKNPKALSHFFTYLTRLPIVVDLRKIPETECRNDMIESSLEGLPDYINRMCHTAKDLNGNGYHYQLKQTSKNLNDDDAFCTARNPIDLCYREPEKDKEAYTFALPIELLRNDLARFLSHNAQKTWNDKMTGQYMHKLLGIMPGDRAPRKSFSGREVTVYHLPAPSILYQKNLSIRG
ncbi:highly derived D5-like helicase-primase [Planoprotostelium fungivorum]|uniref:Highly derived D5-like helicase-primase n=1 Tax=Planoprotostelium fungivorum TaxID=1890364 RepID=A0A2P6MUK2_9EUKA|nr:highly derived D5-like helicase-primase [Planoprotostelium fungivorum]